MDPAKLRIETFIETTFSENAYLVIAPDAEGTEVGWAIDPGFPPQVQNLIEYIADQQIRLEKILLTHGHLDHIAGVDELHAACPSAAILIAGADEAMLANPQKNLSGPFGMDVAIAAKAGGHLEPGIVLTLADLSWTVLDTSGHSPGGRSIYCAAAEVVFTGDALFWGSIGRTDLPGCSHEALLDNIRKHLLSLPDQTKVYSGHGPPTTIGNERKSNPFLSE